MDPRGISPAGLPPARELCTRRLDSTRPRLGQEIQSALGRRFLASEGDGDCGG
ncbi:hypothetical protein T484DRAFT_1935578 [Baffinella frigidus]|nr:hypothetical protein T484DRAFT_1935578 [Cryptophyta sp. CCMP2293]